MKKTVQGRKGDTVNNEKRMLFKFLIDLVCETTSVPESAIVSGSRRPPAQAAKKILCYFAYWYTNMTLYEISDMHGAVCHATAWRDIREAEKIIDGYWKGDKLADIWINSFIIIEQQLKANGITKRLKEPNGRRKTAFSDYAQREARDARYRVKGPHRSFIFKDKGDVPGEGEREIDSNILAKEIISPKSRVGPEYNGKIIRSWTAPPRKD